VAREDIGERGQWPFNCGVLQQLRDEVIDFWSNWQMTLTGSRIRE
jgi:hypothetical protein